MDRIFLESEKVDSDNFSHVIRSQRHRLGDKIEIVINEKIYLCRIDEILKDTFNYSIIEEVKENFGGLNIFLFQGYINKKKMEHVFKSNGMLGVKVFIPIKTERCQEKKIENYNNERSIAILRDSAEVSKSNRIPEILETMDFKQALDFSKSLDYNIILYESEETNSLYNFLCEKRFEFPDSISIGIFVGPEGGFSKEEVDIARNKGVLPIRIFKNILRTEYAGFSAISSILTYYERTRYESKD